MHGLRPRRIKREVRRRRVQPQVAIPYSLIWLTVLVIGGAYLLTCKSKLECGERCIGEHSPLNLALSLSFPVARETTPASAAERWVSVTLRMRAHAIRYWPFGLMGALICIPRPPAIGLGGQLRSMGN